MFVSLLQCQIVWGSPCSVSVSIATAGLFLHPLAIPLGFLGGVLQGSFEVNLPCMLSTTHAGTRTLVSVTCPQTSWNPR